MKIHAANLKTSAVGKEQYPRDHFPEIALAGRSNVGKSSFINRMLGRRNLVRTSSKPGKTRTLNFYTINDSFYFVDVPGYGYAKVSKREREKWGQMMEEYFETREQLKVVVLITDIRHRPTEDDLQMIEYISYLQLPLVVIGTKLDRVQRSKRQKQIAQFKKYLAHIKDITLIPFSAETGENKHRAWKELTKYI